MYINVTIEEKLSDWFLVYGMGCYNPSKFRAPINDEIPGFLLKPKIGGLWSSPIKSPWGWKDWCDSEMFYKGWGFSCGFKFKLKKNAKIYVINSIQDFDQLPKRFKLSISMRWVGEKYDIDWEKMSLEYDGLLLTYRGYCEFRESTRLEFFSWDCESLLIFNLNCISLVKSLRRCELPIHSHTYNPYHDYT